MKDLLIIPLGTIKRKFNYTILLLVTSAILNAGCSKTLKEEGPLGEAIDLIFTVDGVDSDITAPNLKASAQNRNYVLLPIDKKANRETVIKDDIAFSIQSDQIRDTSGFENLVKKSSAHRPNLYAATVPMENNIKYWLLVYTNANVLVASIQVNAGQEQHISVTSGQTYKWYAYSYNSTTSITAPIPSNPVLTTPTSSPLLYDSGVITPTANGTKLPIVFKHQLTQFQIEIRDRSGFRDVTNTEGEFIQEDAIKTATFNILTAAKSNLTSAHITDLDFASETQGGVVKRVARYYTAQGDIGNYGVKINSIKFHYKAGEERTSSGSNLPNDGYQWFTFGTNPPDKIGYVLKGTIEISVRLPYMTVLSYSNSANNDGYRLGPNSGSGKFLRTLANFGPTSDYVRIEQLYVEPPSDDNLAGLSYDKFKARMSDRSRYPDVLVLANNVNYWDAQCWVLINDYIDRGGNVFYTHDAAGGELYAATGIGNIIGGTVGIKRNVEDYSVYKFTDTPEGAADDLILNGPFGDARPHHWGQDRLGATYITGYSGNNVIVYSNKAQNKTSPSNPGMVLFRHKTKGFFFAGDGGFFLYNNIAMSNTTREPFRINSNNFPILADYGAAAGSNTPAAGTSAGGFKIANSIVFGNVMSWMLNRAHYHGINRN